MINKLGEVMLYVNDQEKSVDFWISVMGFKVVSDGYASEGMKWIKIAPTEESETGIVLFDKDLVAKFSPELHLGTPSLMFFTNDIDKLYENLLSKGIKVGDIVTTPTGKVFNFSDYEDNYFAVKESK